MTVDSHSELRSFKNVGFFRCCGRICIWIPKTDILSSPYLSFVRPKGRFLLSFPPLCGLHSSCMWREKPVEMVYVAQNSRLLRPWDDSGHWVNGPYSLITWMHIPINLTFDFPLLAVPSTEPNGFGHLFASMGFIRLLDLHLGRKTIKVLYLEYTDIKVTN